MKRPAALLSALAVLLLPLAAAAAPIDWADGITTPGNPGADLGSASYSTWSVDGERITLRFLLPLADAQRVAGSDIEVLVQQRVGQYLLDHLAVRSGGTPCEAIDQGYDIGRVDPLTVAAGLYGFEIFFQCASPAAGLVLEDHALFDRLPGQVNFARVQVADGPFRAQLFSASQQRLSLPARGSLSAAHWHRYAALGFTRMLGRWDRLCFLLGIVLLARRAREVQAVGAGLAVGYLLSLLATMPGNLVPRGGLLGAAGGLLVALVAARLLVGQLARPRRAIITAMGALLCLAALALLAHATWPLVLLLAGAALFAGGVLGMRDTWANPGLQAALLAAVFGFLDGFVLPAALAPQPQSGRALWPMVTGYDLGAWFAALCVVGLLWLARAALVRWLRQARYSAPRALIRDAATAMLGGLGVFWMLSRLHG